MSYTKLELLDAYCRFHKYQDEIETEVDGEITNVANTESKIDFLTRTEREISKKHAIRQLRMEARDNAESQVITDTDKIDL